MSWYPTQTDTAARHIRMASTRNVFEKHLIKCETINSK